MKIIKGIVIVAALVASGFSTGCMTTKQLEVQVTKDASAVQGCTMVSAVTARPPYDAPGDDYKKLQMKAAKLDADKVLVAPGGIFTTTGVAYRCGSHQS